MPYVIAADIIERYGQEFYDALADPDMDGNPDVARTERAVEDASSLIDGYLGTRYELPLAVVPQVVKRICIDIAAYHLCPDASAMTDIIEKRYEAAIKICKDISAGRASLGEAEPKGGALDPGTIGQGDVLVSGPERIMSRENLKGM